MKKTLLALAAIAASSAAFAQSSVSVYGVVDASVESVKGVGTSNVTRVSSGNLASSRLGFKGTEDLGGGLKANFVLEAALDVDTGETKKDRFFDRAAWVGIAGGFGELRLGRQDTSIGLLAGNTSILGQQGYDDLKIAKTFSGDAYRRTDNAITYILPKFVDGLSAQVQYSTAADYTKTDNGETAGSKRGEHYGLNVQYAANGFSAGLGYISAKNDVAGDIKDTGLLAYLGYDFGVAKLTGYFEQDKRDGAAEKRQVVGGRVDVPVGKDFKLQASYSQVKDHSFSATDTNGDDAKIIALKGVYSLSKRTSVYALFTNVKNDDKSALSLDSKLVTTPATLGKTSRGFAIGLSHKF